MKRIDPVTGASPEASSLKRVTLCVDDFGMHEGVNTSVLMLMALERLGATSVLVDGMAAAYGAERLTDAMQTGQAHVDVGLHLNLSEPLAQSSNETASRDAAPAQAKAAGFRCMRLPSLIAFAYGRVLSASAMRDEIHRQCAVFEQLFKRPPDYVDGHQHVHQLPVVRNALVQVLASRYGQQRPWLRRTRPAKGTRILKAHVIEALGGRALTRLATKRGYPQNAHLLGVHEFTSDPLVYQDRLAQWLADSSDGDLLMCHPSTWCAAPGLLLRQRMAEHDVLTGPGFERQLTEAGVVLSRFAAANAAQDAKAP
jgi:predicted glycoside hydrolase/deacetylase ChbG (UPF0249 family)